MRVISDCHIDDGQGSFKGNYPSLHDFLDEAGQEPIIWNGDTLDLWKVEWYQVMNGPYRGLIRRMEHRFQDVIIPGNHDLCEKALRAFFPNQIILSKMQIGDREIFHGFEVDPLLDSSSERWIVAAFDRLMTQISALNELRDKIAATSRSNDPLIDALKGDEKNKGRRFLLGHSHVAQDLGWFTNSGSLLEGPGFPWVDLDEKGNCTLKYFGKEAP